MPRRPGNELEARDDRAGATLRTPADLAAAGLAREDALAVSRRYAVAITPPLAALIDRDDPADPIARQFVPDARELARQADELDDPIGDDAHSPIKGIVHRYPDRVLLKPTHVCPVYCRFCFRREMVGPTGESLTARELEAAIGYIALRPSIWEVILTGGDPLVLAPRAISRLVLALDRIDHVAVVRVHTRVPIAQPERVTDALAGALVRASGRPTYVAIHANHPRELTPAVASAAERLARRGIPLVGQTVLLRGVNDDAATLEALFRGMVAMRVLPYYLHHPDRAPGTAHFRVSIDEGRAIMRALRGRVSGLALPTYVLDIPGGFGKVPIGPEYLTADGNVTDPRGDLHALG